ncbi:hypothetical protein Hypma_006546 [Hypsizygus marmoreus]|uniref:Uncharacterized protein n=1 Tax=Hypsizygus marmoreus TaxID=39966 RepID=A0A369JWA2_HYPMA|nr:hypothetical protein Hypma_006546 [Hypsizygus marmoreus]
MERGPLPVQRNISAEEEIFMRTLAFFCLLSEKGCSFDADIDGDEFQLGSEDVQLDPELDSDSDSDAGAQINVRAPLRPKERCNGKLGLFTNQYGRSSVRCRFRTKEDPAHLILRNLDEFNLLYLQALFENDHDQILRYEVTAKAQGYGPLFPCSFSAAPSAQKQLCPFWHRFSDGRLQRGVLDRIQYKCETVFDIFTPYDLTSCPQVVVISRNPHSHPPPFPVKTPAPLLDIFSSLLLDMGWKLADATPRKVMIDSGFMSGLRRELGWNQSSDPALWDLHPSLGNQDHTRRYINTFRSRLFPNGTGFEGAKALADVQMNGPTDEKYVRCAETHTLDDGKPFQLVICMTPTMSAKLMGCTNLSIDTSFKRLHRKWQEFEIEAWDNIHMRSVVVVRAFTTSQSADAHFILFTRIFEIATSDTGLPVLFMHIHGQGFQSWIADAHKGQGLGLGKFCQALCAMLEDFCKFEPTRRLRDLDPYDHLRRFFRLCITHFKRHIRALHPYITKEAYFAMLSLSSSQPLADLEGTFRVIELGGKKAASWLQDKLVGTKFALPALYQPLSLIPLDIWKASPTTTNGNEQAHRNVNRDGVNLTILAGIMRGMQYDKRAMTSIQLHASTGIYVRDQFSTHFLRQGRAIKRHGIVQRRMEDEHNRERNEGGNTQHSKTSAQSNNRMRTQTALYTMVPMSSSETEQALMREWESSESAFDSATQDNSPWEVPDMHTHTPAPPSPILNNFSYCPSLSTTDTFHDTADFDDMHEQAVPNHAIVDRSQLSRYSTLTGALGDRNVEDFTEGFWTAGAMAHQFVHCESASAVWPEPPVTTDPEDKRPFSSLRGALGE